MNLAFCLYKYFPFGGLQRDFLRIALECQNRGHAVRVYTLEWRGDIPDGFEVVTVPVRAFSNIRRYKKFSEWVGQDLQRRTVDRVVGFNKMPGLDVYFAADPCFLEKALTLRTPFYRYTSRFKHFSSYEQAVFSPDGRTEILMISSVQEPFFIKHYGTPGERFHFLPPGISRDRRRPSNADEVRTEFRKEFGLEENDLLLLQIGSGFKTKGLDRSLAALAHLPPDLKARTRLMAIGQDEPSAFIRLARSLGVADRVSILSGRSDIPRFLLGADLLVHPAYNENTGTVLLEALVAGLPVLASAVCGYAHYIVEADGGQVIPEPFAQSAFEALLVGMLADPDALCRWKSNALAFAETADIYSNAERAADLILGERK